MASETGVWAAGDDCEAAATARCDAVGTLIANDPTTAAYLALGDLQYDSGLLSDLNTYYDPKMGAGKNLKAKTLPVPGNHEYESPGAAGYHDYWGTQAGDPTKGYYSVDLGGWRIVAANSNCSTVAGCGAGSPQGQFIQSQLATAPGCTLVFTHHPAVTDREYYPGTPSGQQLFDLAYDGQADLSLSGHDHNYRAFPPMNKAAEVDTSNGVRQFVVGSGGRSLYGFNAVNRAQYRTAS